MTTSKTRAAALRALLATTSLASPVLAQSAQPTYRNLDANNVDLVRGDFVLEFVEGSIGSGDAEISLVRTGFGDGVPWEHLVER